MGRNSRNHKKNKSQFRLTYEEYKFEFTVTFLLIVGIFLLFEKMEIKGLIFDIGFASISFLYSFFNNLLANVTNTLKDVELSDISGLILISIAFYMIGERIRDRLIAQFTFLNECPKCGQNIQRVRRNYKQKLIQWILFAKVSNYTCNSCDFKGIKVEKHR